MITSFNRKRHASIEIIRYSHFCCWGLHRPLLYRRNGGADHGGSGESIPVHQENKKNVKSVSPINKLQKNTPVPAFSQASGKQSPAPKPNKANSSEKPKSDYAKLGDPATEWRTIESIQQAPQNKNNSKLQARAKKLLNLHKAIESHQRLTVDSTLGILSDSQQEVVKAINKILDAKGFGWSFYCSGNCKDARSLQEVLDRLKHDI